MEHGRVWALSIAAAAGLAGVVGAATGTPALLAATPAGAGIYLAVGLGVPQLYVGRRTGDKQRLGLGVLAVAAAAVAFVGGSVLDARVPLVELLVVVVAGNGLVSTVRAFRQGYATTGDEQ
jgi:hypothetical protein